MPDELFTPMLPVVALFLAGLGLFFFALSGLRQSVQGLAGRRVQGWLRRWSRSAPLAGLCGFLLGALTQSVTAVAFIVASLVGAGLLDVARALPVVASANLGTAALVLLASIDIHLAVLLLLGLMGIAATFNVGGRARAAFAALFFAALLFFGLRQMREAFGPLPSMPWFARVTSMVQGSVLVAFLLGAVLRTFIQSSPAIAIIAIAFSTGGLITSVQAMAMMFGTGLGVGGAVLFLSSGLRGMPRQITLYQAMLSASASAVASGALLLERLTGWPLVVAALQALPGSDSARLACAFVALQVIAVCLALATARLAVPLLARLAPPTAEQDLSRPQFIHDQAAQEPESALMLAAREQQRLLERLPQYLDAIRRETVAANVVPPETFHRATLAVAAELQGFLDRLPAHASSPATAERWLQLQQRESLLVALSETTRDFTAAAGALRHEPALHELVDTLAEGLHALLSTVVEGVNDPSADPALLLAMTSDRGVSLQRMRARVTASAPDLSQETRLRLVYATSLFERAVWLLRQRVQSFSTDATATRHSTSLV